MKKELKKAAKKPVARKAIQKKNAKPKPGSPAAVKRAFAFADENPIEFVGR